MGESAVVVLAEATGGVIAHYHDVQPLKCRLVERLLRKVQCHDDSHAGQARLRIKLVHEPGQQCRVTVADDGKGEFCHFVSLSGLLRRLAARSPALGWPAALTISYS